jgi:type I restriction enzyme S subunit
MNWIKTTVGEFCPFIYGKGLPKTKRDEGPVPVYGSNGCVDYHTDSYVKGPGIIIGRKGSVGAIHLSEVPFWPIDTSFYLEKESLEELSFTYYLLKSLGLEDMNSDSAVPGLNRENAHALSIQIPEKTEDREAIGRWISIYDKKIQLNRQTNQTLEHIAQAIFKSWFVDFEPTRAKIIIKQKGGNELAQELAAQALICGAITLHKLAELEEGLCGIEKELHPLITKRFPNKGGVDLWQPQQLAAIAALFPNSLVDSELGEVPEGWEVVGFKDIVEKYIDNRGKTPPTKESGIPLLEVKHLPEGSIKPNLNTSKYVDDETFESCFRAHLETDDIMISTVGTIGRICMVPAGKKIAIAQNLLGMRFNREKVSPYFMYYQMDGFRFRHDVDARLVITVQASIKRKDLETINLLGPPIELQNQFERCVLPFVSMQQTNQEIELADVRDTLLPKLLSGELTTVATQEANHV